MCSRGGEGEGGSRRAASPHLAQKRYPLINYESSAAAAKAGGGGAGRPAKEIKGAAERDIFRKKVLLFSR